MKAMMAVSLRCASTARNLLLRNTANFGKLSFLRHHFSPLKSILDTSVLDTRSSCNYPVAVVDFLRESRRGFAKGRKSRADDDDTNTVEMVPDIGPSVKATALSQMQAAIDALSRELSKLRTGRASAGMLDHIIIETSGMKMPLNHVAVVSVIDSQTLSVTPYDPNALKELEHAIVSSPLGLNPTLEGQRLIATIPPLTKEHIQAMCKVVAKSSEVVKQSIRRARQKVDEMTKKFVKSAEDMCKVKEKEIKGS
ncbi:PREDICTED: uncharacterized protein LOC104601561 isoform X2 [Nelumbo nucifera]|uniref:Ribosome-recycling factor, chloroplastic n=1 Tax=Nelumbo nucifera TaxID=4432 RepID=A0A1U8AKU7_NELNU|nr:PREDICTED: uncharacterized protein LOC104601561 isoform X2 [Nelumbo nucifera]